MAETRALLAWSGGKDSAWALHMLRASGMEVAGLFTTVREDTGRVAIHEVPGALVRMQAAAVGLPVDEIPLPVNPANAVYEGAMARFVEGARSRGITHLAFGDLFLEEIRRYRERQFASSGMELVFPLWGLPTRALAEEMTARGLRAWITCVDTTQAPAEWAGRLFDADFLRALPAATDPCGENGEFHTFVFEGPMLDRPLPTRAHRRPATGRWAHADVVVQEAGR